LDSILPSIPIISLLDLVSMKTAGQST